MNKEKLSTIDRRQFIKSIIYGSLTGASAGLAANCGHLPGMGKATNPKQHETGKASTRPNIILCLVDDQVIRSFDVIPSIQSQLVGKGITFSNAFCTSPLCAPARASILSGQYLHNLLPLAEHRNDKSINFVFAGNRDKRDTISTVLKVGGYTNILLGKYINGYNSDYIPPGWDEWHAFRGIPGYYDYKLNENGKTTAYGRNESDYSTDVLAQMAINFISSRATSANPFFMYLAPYTPHAPRIPAPRHKNKFSFLKIYQPDTEEDTRDKPRWVNEYRRLYPGPRPQDGKKRIAKREIRGLECLLAVDDMLNLIIKKLEETCQLANTYIFYLADNGDDRSAHVAGSGKLLPYEEGIRTPIVVRGPGIEPGAKRDHLVSTVDLLPTIAALAGIPQPAFTDGRPLLPLFTGVPLPPSHWRQAILVEAKAQGYWYRNVSPPAYRLLRASHFKYIEYETGEKEFYDLRKDPREFSNIYEKLEPRKKLILDKQLQRMSKVSGKECCRLEEDFNIYEVL